MPRAWLASPAVLAVLAVACASTPTGTVRLDVGEETDALTRAPAPVTLVVSTIDLAENVKEVARTSLPASGIDVGDLPKTDVGAIRVVGLGADGATLVKGSSLFVQWGALELSDLPVFVQRTGELARLPSAPTLEANTALVVNGRYVLEASGTSAALYDLLQLRTFTGAPTLPRPARSLASYATVALVVDELGATVLDLNDGGSYALPTPSGGAFSEVAGGLTFQAKDGTQLVVGATRRDAGAAPTARVLRIGPSGDVTFASLAAPRAGACATWVEGRGLVVWGGSDTAPGGELLAPGATASVTLPFPPDAVTGCAVAPLDASRVVVAGGVRADGTRKTRAVDLACAAACTPELWTSDVPVVRGEALAVGAGAVLVLGDDTSGRTRAFRVTKEDAREVATRTTRKGARLVPSPTGGALVLGGGPGIEQYQE